jgi:small-conductance mechanosensitive channel
MARRWVLGVALLLCLATGAPAQAQDSGRAGEGSPTAAAPAEQEWSRAPVTLDGATLFTLRGIRDFPAKLRAKAVAERLRDAAADPSFSADALQAREEKDRTSLAYGDKLLLWITDLDAEDAGIHRNLLAEVVRGRILAGVEQYRREREPQRVWRNAGFAAAASLGLLALLFLLRWGFRRLRATAERRLRGHLDGLEAQSRSLLQARRIGALIDGLLVTLQWLAYLAIAAVFTQFVLGLFPWTRPLATFLFALVIQPLRTMRDGLLQALPDLAFLVVLTIVVRYVLKLARLFFGGIEAGTIKVASFEPDWAWPTYRILRVAIVAFALVIGYPYIPGSSSEAFKGISIFLGVIFSLGSTSFISNIIAGYTMVYRRAFRVGDRIKVDDHFGDVTEVGLQVTRLRSPKNEQIVLPNSQVLGSNLINYSALAHNEGLILYTRVGIGYETSWRQVEAMLLQAADRTEGLLKEPRPFVLQKELGDFAVTYEVNGYTDRPLEMLRLKSEMHRNILDLFNEYGVQIMTPAYEGDPEQPKVVAKENWFAAPAARQPDKAKR